VVPLGNDRQVECDRKELEAAVGRVQAVAEERGYALKFEAGDGTLKLSVRDEAFGSTAEEVMGCEYYGEPVALGLNSKYLMEVLGRIGDDVVVISVGDEKTQVLVRGKDAVESLFVVMLMRLK
jgi:DNA polymerase-3 subunit beta